MPELSIPDLIAISWFLLLWCGYTLYSDKVDSGGRNLVATMAQHREMWMLRMLGRDNRMVDIQIIRNLTRTASFFASTSILILAGLVTVLGAAEKVVVLTASIPLVSTLTPLQWELRLLCLILIFIYSFFKFAWSIRQVSYCAIQIGAMDPVSDLGDDCEDRAKCIARLATLAAVHFNRGLRGYYFAMALLAWFIHPIALGVTATWVVLVLYRREFHSRTLKILQDGGGFSRSGKA